eukprot:7555239-Pyramimonas_sp.AAC.1
MGNAAARVVKTSAHPTPKSSANAQKILTLAGSRSASMRRIGSIANANRLPDKGYPCLMPRFTPNCPPRAPPNDTDTRILWHSSLILARICAGTANISKLQKIYSCANAGKALS